MRVLKCMHVFVFCHMPDLLVKAHLQQLTVFTPDYHQGVLFVHE